MSSLSFGSHQFLHLLSPTASQSKWRSRWTTLALTSIFFITLSLLCKKGYSRIRAYFITVGWGFAVLTPTLFHIRTWLWCIRISITQFRYLPRVSIKDITLVERMQRFAMRWVKSSKKLPYPARFSLAWSHNWRKYFAVQVSMATIFSFSGYAVNYLTAPYS